MSDAPPSLKGSSGPSAHRSIKSPSPSFRSVLQRVLPLLSVVATSNELVRLALTPVYDASSSLYHRNWDINVLALVYIACVELSPSVERVANIFFPIWGTAAPLILSLSFRLSEKLGPRYGPVVTGLVIIMPLIFTCFLRTLKDAMRWVEPQGTFLGITGQYRAAPVLLILWLLFYCLKRLAILLVQMTINSDLGPTGTRFGLLGLTSCLYCLWAPSRTRYILLAIAVAFFSFSTHIPTSNNNHKINQALRKYNFSLIERRESVTGYISVLENTEAGYRVMRCDHSLLGGEWIAQVEDGRPREPIYTVFIMLEAVRLVETEARKQSVAIPDRARTALVM